MLNNKLEDVVVNVDNLIELGLDKYLENSKNNIVESSQKIVDLLHVLEADEGFNLTDEEYLNIAKELAKLRRLRRRYKNEVNFLEHNVELVNSYITLTQKVYTFNKMVCNRVYTPKALKEEIGGSILVGNRTNIISQEIEDRLISLEVASLRKGRRDARAKGKVVPIENLRQTWRADFYNLPEETRLEILAEANDKYDGIEYAPVKELHLWGRIIPKIIYDRGLFLR